MPIVQQVLKIPNQRMKVAWSHLLSGEGYSMVASVMTLVMAYSLGQITAASLSVTQKNHIHVRCDTKLVRVSHPMDGKRIGELPIMRGKICPFQASNILRWISAFFGGWHSAHLPLFFFLTIISHMYKLFGSKITY